jgi:hypothetical protein
MAREPLTDEQVDNWRNVLCGMYGIVGLLMPREQIEKLVDRYQDMAIRAAEEAAPCSCDPSRNGTTKHTDGRVTCNKCGKEREQNV